jgi:hypothetical protein
VSFDACSFAREGGSGTLRHPATAIGGVADWVDALVCAVVSVWDSVAELVDSDPLTVPAFELEELGLEEPHAARINAAQAAAQPNAGVL